MWDGLEGMKMKGEVIQDPDEGFIDGRKWVEDRRDDIQMLTGLVVGKIDDEAKQAPDRKVLYVSW